MKNTRLQSNSRQIRPAGASSYTYHDLETLDVAHDLRCRFLHVTADAICYCDTEPLDRLPAPQLLEFYYSYSASDTTGNGAKGAFVVWRFR